MKMKNFFVRRLPALLLAAVAAVMVSCGTGVSVASSNAPASGASGESKENTTGTPVETGETGRTETSLPPQIDRSGELLPTELMVHNRTTVPDEQGAYPSWLELHNVSGETLSLFEFSLLYGTSAYRLPDVQLNSGEYYLFFLPEEPEETGTITVSHKGSKGVSFSYSNPSPDHSFLFASGAETDLPTPGTGESALFGRLLISEVLPLNTHYPVNGQIGNYLELYNPGTEGLRLSEFYLSDSAGNLLASKLPDEILEPGAYRVLLGDELGVLLSSGGKTLYLTHQNGGRVSSFSYPEAEKNKAFDGKEWAEPSPGYPNTEEGRNAYLMNRRGLVINEAISSNSVYNPRNGDCSDMLELKNTGNEALNLADFYLSDSRKNLQKYRLPAVTLQPGELYVVYCDEEGKDCCPFNLSKDGEFVLISEQSGKITDALDLPYIPSDRSWGRSEKGLCYFETPTFGRENGEGFREVSGKPQASVESGFYQDSFFVTFPREGKIYYTTDGGRPTSASTLYAGERIPVSESMALRAVWYEEGKLPGEDVIYNYFVDAPEGVNATDLELPVVKITTLEKDMYGESGIYTNWEDREMEVPGNVALYVNGKEEFALNCGVRLFGDDSRNLPKKSFRVKFRAKYGSSKLKYDVFGDGEITEFDDLVLRCGSQDYYNAMMRDEFATGIAGEYCPELLVQKYRPVNVYVNGEYKGVYYIREKINPDFIAAHTGVSPSSVTVVANMNHPEWGTNGDGIDNLWNYIMSHDMTNPSNYAYVSENLSIESTMDYYILLCWADNRDLGNTRIYYSSEGDGKWRFLFYDCDLGFGIDSRYASVSTVTYLYDWKKDSKICALFVRLLENQQFRDQFLKRLAELTTTALSDQTVLGRIEELRAAIDHDMKYMVYMYSYEDWSQVKVPRLQNYVTGRGKQLQEDFAALLGLTEEEKTKYFG